jgi:hypothetical protein
MNGMDRTTKKRKGRMTKTFLAKWIKGSLAKSAMPTRTNAKRPKRRKEMGGELTPTNMMVKKTRIFALASR